ncbi:MAG: hypothetical protein V7776_11055 [Halopseudomonas aestusnigri]
MKNIQIIDGADNCTYSIFNIDDHLFELIFPNNQDIEFIEDFMTRLGQEKALICLTPLWKNEVDKKEVLGIHGTLFYQNGHKKKYYPTKKDAEMIINPFL